MRSNAAPRDRFTADMLAYDSLGPLARAAIARSPAELWVADMLLAWRQANPELMMRDEGYVLTDPAIDASVAEFVRGAIRRKFGKSPEAFVVDRRAAFRDGRRTGDQS